MRTQIAGVAVRFSLLLLLLFAAILLSSPLQAKSKYDKCSAEGQPPCPVLYKGPICDKGLGNFKGTCKRCGGEAQKACPISTPGPQCADGRMKIDGYCYHSCGGPNQKACPKIKKGFPCRGNYEPDSRNFCKPCGGRGQKPCRAFKPGERCQKGLTILNKVCNSCGGPNELACPKIKKGFPCRGNYEPDVRGYCKPCGGKGQKYCRAFKPGKQCESGLTKLDGICDTCGGPGELACPKIKKGFPCRGNYEPNQAGYCKPCGGKGQGACRALKPGKQCQPGLTKIKGVCDVCGGPNEKACPRIKSGFPCRGSFEPDENGICKPCGGAGQLACRALKKGRQCEEGYTERDGMCQACGGLNQRACKVTDKGKPCQEGLKLGLNGVCKKSIGFAVRQAGLKELNNIGSGLLAAVGNALRLNKDNNLRSKIAKEDKSVSVPDNGACPGKQFKSWTIGVGGETGVIVNVGGEVGLAMRCGKKARNASDEKNVKWYTGGSLSFGLGGGASINSTFGWWVDEVNQLRGKSHGYALDLVEAVNMGKALKARELSQLTSDLSSAGLSAAIGMWFERRDEDGDNDDEVGKFQGFTLSLGPSVGADLGAGGQYIRSTTNQKCDAEMKCAEGVWEGLIAGKRTLIYIEQRRDGDLDVGINDGEYRRYERKLKSRRYDDAQGNTIRFRKNYRLLKFDSHDGKKGEFTLAEPSSVEGVWSSKDPGDPFVVVVDSPDGERLYASVNRHNRTPYHRGKLARRTYKNSAGAIIAFRKNYSVMKFKDAAGNKHELKPGNEGDAPADSVTINVLGMWVFTVNGKSFTEEFIEQRGNTIVVRRVGTTLTREYIRTDDNEYSTEYGGTFRFVSEDRAVWVSPDGETIFKLTKR